MIHDSEYGHYRFGEGIKGLTPMTTELSESLRQEQQLLLEHWSSMAPGGGIPYRSRIHPGEFRRWLSRLSILQPQADGRMVFRLSGSRLRDVIGTEPRGRTTADFPLCRKAWHHGVTAAISEARPIVGTSQEGETLTHSWMRLPLICDRTRQMLVLCHDRYPTFDQRSATPDDASDHMLKVSATLGDLTDSLRAAG